MALQLWFLVFSLFPTGHGVYEARIYADAPTGTPLTLEFELKSQLQTYRGCFVHIRDFQNGLKWNIARWNLETSRPLSQAVGNYFTIETIFFCANGQKTHDVIVHVSKRNHHPPEFGQDEYHFYVPFNQQIDTEIGDTIAWDKDSVIYNAQPYYVIEGQFGERFTVDRNGTVRLKTSISDLTLYESLHLKVEACDLGSPQFCSEARLFVTPVTVTAPRDLSVNVVTKKYQVFEWKEPHFGTPKTYRVTVQPLMTADKIEYTSNLTVDGKQSFVRFITRANLYTNVQYEVNVVAIDETGETPSQPIKIHWDLNLVVKCDGICANGGQPACFRADQIHVQFQGFEGPQCVCFPGFQGNLCNKIAVCPTELQKSTIGMTPWPETIVNSSSKVVCPFGPKQVKINRTCGWNEDTNEPQWGTVREFENCRDKNKLMTYIGFLTALYLNDSKVTSGQMRHVLESIESVLPAAVYDQQICEHIFQVVGRVMMANWTSVKENPSNLKHRYLNVIKKISAHRTGTKGFRLGNEQSNIFATSIDLRKPGKFFIGNEAVVEILENTVWPVDEHRLTVIYMKNSSLYWTSDGKETGNPVLELFLGLQPDLTLTDLNKPIRYGLSPIQGIVKDKNHSCVYYSESDNLWTTRTMKTISQNNSGMIMCETKHLSAFSILLVEEKPIQSASLRVFSYLILFACSISILLLLITIISYMYLKCSVQEYGCQILVNLCMALILINFGVLLGSLSPSLNFEHTICTFIGIFVHYGILSALLWIAIEAVNYYRNLAHMDESPRRNWFLVKGCLIAWGIPAVFVTISYLVDSEFYLSMYKERCSPKPIALYYVPVCLFFTIDLLLFFIIFINSRSQASSRAFYQTRSQVGQLRLEILASFCILISFGLCWSIVTLIQTIDIVVIIFLCIFGPLQSVIIFGMRCICRKPVRDLLWPWQHHNKNNGDLRPLKSITQDQMDNNSTAIPQLPLMEKNQLVTESEVDSGLPTTARLVESSHKHQL